MPRHFLSSFTLLSILLMAKLLATAFHLSHFPMMLVSHNEHYRICLRPPGTLTTICSLSGAVLIYTTMSSDTSPMQSSVAQLALRNYSLLLNCWISICFGR